MRRYNEENLLEEMPLGKKIATILLIFLIFFLISAYILGTFANIAKNRSIIYSLFYGIKNYYTYCLFLGITATFLITFMIYFKRRNMRNAVESVKDGVYFAKDKNSGASAWMTKEQINDVFFVGNVRDTTNTIYGRLNDYGSNQVVARKKKEPKKVKTKDGIIEIGEPEGNRNVLVVATMGSGKTYTYVENEIIQTVLRGDSFVITDPKGEVFNNLAKFCLDHGVEVHTLNLVDPQYSEFWNCLRETINPETERIDATRLDQFVLIYMENSSQTEKRDFWFNCSLNLLKTAIGYIAWCRETDIIKGFLRLYCKIANVSSDEFTETAISKNHSMKYFKDKIRMVAIQNGYNIDEINSIIEDIEKYSSKYKFTIGEVQEFILDFKKELSNQNSDIINTLKDIPLWHPARVAFITFTTNDTEAVQNSAIQNTDLAFSIFTNQAIKDTLSNDGMWLSNINEKQSGYFIIMSDKPGGEVYKPVLSLFFSFFFKDTMDNYDRWNQICAETGEQNPCRGVTAMLEEFYSIGKINSFDRVMTTVRSRHIYVSIIIQQITLIEALYGKYIVNTIIGGCDTTYFLGANDKATMNYISEFCGVATILKESHVENQSIISNMDKNVNISSGSRSIVTTEESRMWKNRVLLLIHGEQPVDLKMFPWTDHWVIRKDKYEKGFIHVIGQNVAPDSAMPYKKFIEPLDLRVEKIELENSKHNLVEEAINISKRINNLYLKNEILEDTVEINVENIIGLESENLDIAIDEIEDISVEDIPEDNLKKNKTKKTKKPSNTARNKIKKKDEKIKDLLPNNERKQVNKQLTIFPEFTEND